MDKVSYYKKYISKNLEEGHSYSEIKNAFIKSGHCPYTIEKAYIEHEKEVKTQIYLIGMIIICTILLLLIEYKITGFFIK